MKGLWNWIWIVLLVISAIACVLSVLRIEEAGALARQIVSPGPLSPRHAYLRDRCDACHESGIGVTVVSCTSCHANAERLLGRQPTAFHASIQECTICHVEHLRQPVRPVLMDHVALAAVGVRTLARATQGDADSRFTLRSLHRWLGFDGPRTLTALDARASLDCAGCHDHRDPHLKRFGDDCAQCHVLDSWLVDGYQHPSPRSRECVQCHQPPPSHGMEHFTMVSQRIAGKEHARVEECFECHNTTSWNDIVNVGMYKHH